MSIAHRSGRAWAPLIVLLGLLPVGGCGGAAHPPTGTVVLETPEELAEAEADSKRLDEQATAEAKAARTRGRARAR